MEDTKKHRVLIIEDEKNLARFVDLEFQHEGYETAICHDGHIATIRLWVPVALKHRAGNGAEKVK